MNYYLDNEIDIKLDFDYEAVYRNCVNAVLDEAGCPYECEVSLLIVDNDSIKEINSDNRNIDSETDVLSFPNSQFEVPGSFDEFEDNDFAFNPETGEFVLGDIVISQDRVFSQADDYGHSVKREFAFLIVHSMLHLIGYDHIQENDREIMENKQRQIMEILNIQRA